MDPELVWVTDDEDAVAAMARLPSMKMVVSVALVAGLTFGAMLALVFLALGI